MAKLVDHLLREHIGERWQALADLQRLPVQELAGVFGLRSRHAGFLPVRDLGAGHSVA